MNKICWVFKNSVKNRGIRVSIIVSLFLLALFINLNQSISVYAYSLTVTTSQSVSLDVKPDFDRGIGTNVMSDEIGIISDCRAGYNLVISGPSDNNIYLNGDSTNNEDGTYFTPVDGVNALNNMLNNNSWGYSLTANSGNGVFTALSSSATVLQTSSQTANPDDDINVRVPVYYGTAVSNEMLPGSYTFANGGQISYQVVMDVSCVPGIHYEPNGADGGVGTMGVQEVAAGDNAYLIAPNYSREGYGFASWNTEPDGTGTNYGPNEYITMPDSGVLVLYANWAESSGDLQGWTGCSSLSINDVIGLTDTRDGNVYAVAKLADGKCWMVENMRLDVGEAEMTVYNSDSPSDAYLAAVDGATPNNGEWCQRSAGMHYSDPCDSEPNYNNNNVNRALTASYNANDMAGNSWYAYGILYNNYLANGVCPAGWKLPTGNIRSSASLAQDYHGLFYALDNGYQVNLDGNNNGTINANYILAYPNNFVPSGEFVYSTTLRGRGSSGKYWSKGHYMVSDGYSLSLEIGNRAKANESSVTWGHTVRCVTGGTLENYTLNYNSNGGDTTIPSATVSANTVYGFTISGVVPQRSGYNFKHWIDKDGNEYNPGDTFYALEADSTLYAIWENIACNPEAETISQAVCLQDMNLAVKATMTKKETYTLKDARDNKQYTVSLLDDDMVWMTQNMDVGGNNVMVLSSSDTDIEGYYFLPASTTSFAQSNYVAQIRVGEQFGGYYSWYAALATNNIRQAYQIATTSVCPSGWDLPLDGHYMNLKNVANLTNSNSARNAPYNFVLGGYQGTNGIYSTSSYGYYWTAVNTDNSTYLERRARYMEVYSYGFGIGDYHDRYYGHSLRCIASQGLATVSYDGNGTIEYPTTGAVESQTDVEVNSAVFASGDGFTRNGWRFDGWNTEPDGSGISVAVRSSFAELGIKNGDSVTLYAKWVPQYEITYVNNCMSWASGDGNCTTSNSARTSLQGIDLDINGDGSGTLGAYNKFTMSGWKIKEWTTNADGTGTAYPVGNSYSVSGASAGDGITLYAHWVQTYAVYYDGNGADNASDGMGIMSSGIKTTNHSNVGDGDTFDLLASNFKRSGYGFVGWSTDQDAWAKLIDNDSTNDVRIWGPNEIFVAPDGGGASIVNLYAIWAPAETDNGSPVYLQNWNGCSSMTATVYNSATGSLVVSKNSVTALTDVRDGQAYAIAKLADGNCWMMENLRLADTHEEVVNNGTQVVDTVLTVANTNIVSTNSTLPITNTYSISRKSNSLSPSSEQNILDDTDYGWCRENTDACNNQSRLNTSNTTQFGDVPYWSQTVNVVNAHSNFDRPVYSYGNYYNWYSATVGYGTNGKNGVTEGDICPAGWHLPYGGTSTSDKGGGTSGGFSYLDIAMGGFGGVGSGSSSNVGDSNKWRMFPNNIIYAGHMHNGTIFDRGGYALYWSATGVGNEASYLYLYNYYGTHVSPGNYANSKYLGYSVRCLSN